MGFLLEVRKGNHYHLFSSFSFFSLIENAKIFQVKPSEFQICAHDWTLLLIWKKDSFATENKDSVHEVPFHKEAHEPAQAVCLVFCCDG